MTGPDDRSSSASPARALVTGGAGFIGSHLVDRLLRDGVEVMVVDDLSSGSLANLPAEIQLEKLDIARDDLGVIFASWRPDVVFHLAAQASVSQSIEDPLRDLAVNVVGTHRVSAAALAVGARRLVFVSSGGAIYGETSRPATERTIPAPTSFYGVHKLAAEGHVAFSGMPYAILRPANVYGARQAAGLEGAVVAAFLDQVLSHRALRIHGDGRQSRDFVHVLDVVEALCQLGRADAPTGIWNVASGHSVTILALAEIVERAFGRGVTREAAARRPADVTHSAVSAAHLRTLGWRPSIGLSSGVRRLVRSAMRDQESADIPAHGPLPSDRGSTSS